MKFNKKIVLFIILLGVCSHTFSKEYVSDKQIVDEINEKDIEFIVVSCGGVGSTSLSDFIQNDMSMLTNRHVAYSQSCHLGYVIHDIKVPTIYIWFLRWGFPVFA